MNRLGKKCLIVTVVLHSLLIGVLLLAPAFSKEEKKPDPPKPISLVHGALIAEILATRAPAPSPPVPAPAPAQKQATRKIQPTPPKKVEAPRLEPKKETPKKLPPKKTTLKKSPPKRVIKVAKTKPTPSKPKKSTIKVSIPDKLQTRSDPEMERREREVRERARKEDERRAKQQRAALHAKLDRATDLIFTDSVTVRISGGSSQATMDYGSYVMQTYDRNWREPTGLSSASTVIITVTISKSGSVKSARISKRSGISQLNSSVESLIGKVRKFRPFPLGMNEAEKTFTIDFNIRSK